MKNVYDAVRFFYEQDAAWNDIIKYEWVEGFLRKKAWQHADDKKLQAMWQQLLMFGLYLAYADISLQQAKLINFREMLNWLGRNVADFKLNSASVERYFNTLIDFYDYLSQKKIVEPTGALREAAKFMARGELKLPDALRKDINLSFVSDKFATPDAPAPIYLKLDEHLQELLLLLNQFYQKREYMPDFERAIFLYHGIMGWDEDDLENRRQDFWLGFWDYFLFDYRLLKNDKTPLRNFRDLGDYPAETAELLDELINARFAVFFVKNVSAEDWLECEDLFTGHNFFLPNPIENTLPLKELLFMGHLFSDNMVLVNYVMSVPVSLKLRRRIKNEVEKQMKFYLAQEPDANWDGFFRRHAVAVRHAIDIFTTFSKLNAVPDIAAPRQAQRSQPAEKLVNTGVIGKLLPAMAENMFSFHDQQLALRMWLDYCAQRKTAVKKPQLWAAGIVAIFVDLNSAFTVDYDYIANIFKVPLAAVYRYKSYISRALGIEPYDLRYLNEEGFIMLLMDH
ncbi:MAG: hypothetical protein LBO03_01390 [Acidaminococcales bacterium]|jgi:hypothetical protein|nr:hypothetical protein [Acidaminococcales bacterium]